MKVIQAPEEEIRIVDENNVILCKFYQCTTGYLVYFDHDRVEEVPPVGRPIGRPIGKEDK